MWSNLKPHHTSVNLLFGSGYLYGYFNSSGPWISCFNSINFWFAWSTGKISYSYLFIYSCWRWVFSMHSLFFAWVDSNTTFSIQSHDFFDEANSILKSNNLMIKSLFLRKILIKDPSATPQKLILYRQSPVKNIKSKPRLCPTSLGFKIAKKMRLKICKVSIPPIQFLLSRNNAANSKTWQGKTQKKGLWTQQTHDSITNKPMPTFRLSAMTP